MLLGLGTDVAHTNPVPAFLLIARNWQHGGADGSEDGSNKRRRTVKRCGQILRFELRDQILKARICDQILASLRLDYAVIHGGPTVQTCSSNTLFGSALR